MFLFLCFLAVFEFKVSDLFEYLIVLLLFIIVYPRQIAALQEYKHIHRRNQVISFTWSYFPFSHVGKGFTLEYHLIGTAE